MSVDAKLRSPGVLLGQPGDNPSVARRFRQTAITAHTLDPASPWQWMPQAANGDELALVAFVPSTVCVESGGVTSDADAGVLLHPHRPVAVSAAEPTSIMCVWVPWHALDEAGDSADECVPSLAPTPLLLGLRGFASTLVGRGPQPTIYTDYLVEKLLAEMVFGVILEAGYGEAAMAREAAGRQPRPLERARTLMLIRKGDPSFGVDDLAKELHLSTRQLQRVFSAEGSSPAEELRRMRAESAQELLSDSSYSTLTVDEIAVHSGFGTSAALRRAFTALGISSPRRRY